MKSLLILTHVFFALNVFATIAPPAYNKVDDSLKVVYVEAINTALVSNELETCSNGSNYSLKATLDLLTTMPSDLYMNRTAQPVFIFRFKDSEVAYHDYIFQTSSDHKQVTQFGFRQYKMMRVNKGTLIDPVIVDDLGITHDVTCRIK